MPTVGGQRRIDTKKLRKLQSQRRKKLTMHLLPTRTNRVKLVIVFGNLKIPKHIPVFFLHPVQENHAPFLKNVTQREKKDKPLTDKAEKIWRGGDEMSSGKMRMEDIWEMRDTIVRLLQDKNCTVKQASLVMHEVMSMIHATTTVQFVPDQKWSF